MPLRPVNAIIAIILSLLPLPALKLLDQINSSCGDGLCGFIPGILMLGSLATATLIFLFRSDRRNEAPALLRIVPFVVWALALVPLML